TVLLAGGGSSGLHFLPDAGALGGGVGEGMIYAFLREDAGHLVEDVGGPLGPLYIGKRSRQFINAGDASLIGLLGGLAKTLAFFPAQGLFGLGKGVLACAFDQGKQLIADFLLGDMPCLCADPLDVPMLLVTEPPDAATYEGEKDKADREGEEDFVLP